MAPNNRLLLLQKTLLNNSTKPYNGGNIGFFRCARFLICLKLIHMFNVRFCKQHYKSKSLYHQIDWKINQVFHFISAFNTLGVNQNLFSNKYLQTKYFATHMTYCILFLNSITYECIRLLYELQPTEIHFLLQIASFDEVNILSKFISSMYTHDTGS